MLTKTIKFKYGFHIFLIFCIFTISSAGDSANGSVVERKGQLKVKGVHIVDSNNEVVVLKGMSLFWSQWIDKYHNYDCIRWLRDDWHCEVIRAAMAIDHDGYLKNPEQEKKKIITVIEACIDLGLYVIVDWHSHKAETQTDEAIAFFSEIARLYGDKPNIIYELYNEPLRVSWKNAVKPYHEAVIKAIREYDTDNIIIAGSPSWSQDVDVAASDPLEGENIAYSLHFYPGTHKQWLRDKAERAISEGLALWVTEFGTVNANGDGPVAYQELQLWFDFMERHRLSWCNWVVSDKDETSSILKPGTHPEGNWKETDLTESGKIIREKLRSANP